MLKTTSYCRNRFSIVFIVTPIVKFSLSLLFFSKSNLKADIYDSAIKKLEGFILLIKYSKTAKKVRFCSRGEWKARGKEWGCTCVCKKMCAIADNIYETEENMHTH